MFNVLTPDCVTAEQVIEILSAGILAPSGDNQQPWKFKLRGNQIDVFLSQRDIEELTFFNAGFRMMDFSVGAVIENMSLMSASLGYCLTAKLFPDPQRLDHIATLSLVPAQKFAHPHQAAIAKRHTNREMYNGTAIDESALSSLKSTVADRVGFSLRIIEKTNPAMEKLAALIGEADQLRFEIETIHRDFMNVIRYQDAPDGLMLKTLGAGPLAGSVFKLISSWQRMCLLNKLGFSRIFKNHARQQILSSGAIGILWAKDASRETFLESGRLMEKIWLEATCQKLAFQPMQALCIFSNNTQLGHTSRISEVHNQVLAELSGRFRALIEPPQTTRQIIFMFRIGHAEAPPARAQRRSLDSFLMAEV